MNAVTPIHPAPLSDREALQIMTRAEATTLELLSGYAWSAVTSDVRNASWALRRAGEGTRAHKACQEELDMRLRHQGEIAEVQKRARDRLAMPLTADERLMLSNLREACGDAQIKGRDIDALLAGRVTAEQIIASLPARLDAKAADRQRDMTNAAARSTAIIDALGLS